MNLFIFDCDGTIVDSQHGIVAAMEAAYQAAELSPPSRAEILSIVGLSLKEVFETLSPDVPAATQWRLAEAYKAAFQQIRVDGQEEALYPGARDVIGLLAQQAQTDLAIATGKSMRGVDRILTQERWHGLFASIQTADTNPSKPHPGMIRAALGEVEQVRGVRPSAVVMIGDTTYDMAMARAAGVRALGVAWGYHDVAQLRLAGADAIAENYGDLPVLLRRLTGG